MNTPLSNKSISSWVRQVRHRAKLRGVSNDFTVADAKALLKETDSHCAICQSSKAIAFTLAFPLQMNMPFIVANVLPVCGDCKIKKNQTDLSEMHQEGSLPKADYVRILEGMLARRGSAEIKDYLRSVLGV